MFVLNLGAVSGTPCQLTKITHFPLHPLNHLPHVHTFHLIIHDSINGEKVYFWLPERPCPPAILFIRDIQRGYSTVLTMQYHKYVAD